jgi:hypothetical protein
VTLRLSLARLCGSPPGPPRSVEVVVGEPASGMTVLPPCPVTNAHRRLMDCHVLWHLAGQSYMEPESFRLNLNNLAQNLRNVTWLLQKQKATFPNFSDWYKPWQDSVAEDPIMRWVVKSRNRIVKESDLELLSLASVQVSLDWANEFAMSWSMPPRYRTRDILIRLLSTQDIPQTGMLTIERRWIDRVLPDSELLDACAYAYNRIMQVIALAHAEAEVERCDLPDRAPPCVDSELVGEPSCMHEWDENRRLNINLDTRTEVSEHLELIPLISEDEVEDRYGESKVTGDAIARVPQIIEMNMRMLARDGGLATVAIFMRDTYMIHFFGLDFFDQASKRLALRRVADLAERYNANGVILVSETWVAPIGPGEDPSDSRTVPARARPDRMEGINVVAITRDGRTASSTCIFSRNDDGTFVFGETAHGTGVQINLLEPLRRRWHVDP